MKFITIILATWFYSGKLPGIPGTWGSLVAAILWWYIPESLFIQLLCILVVSIAGIYISGQYEKLVNQSDPPEVVIDEVAGMWLSLLLIPHTLWLFGLAFIIFRLLDIVKPLFIDKLQEFEGGLGIMLDDIAAGLITFFLIHAIRIIF